MSGEKNDFETLAINDYPINGIDAVKESIHSYNLHELFVACDNAKEEARFFVIFC